MAPDTAGSAGQDRIQGSAARRTYKVREHRTYDAGHSCESPTHSGPVLWRCGWCGGTGWRMAPEGQLAECVECNGIGWYEHG